MGNRGKVHRWRRHFCGKRREKVGESTGEFKNKPSLLRNSRRKEQEAGGRSDCGRCHARVLISYTFSLHGNVTTPGHSYTHSTGGATEVQKGQAADPDWDPKQVSDDDAHSLGKKLAPERPFAQGFSSVLHSLKEVSRSDPETPLLPSPHTPSTPLHTEGLSLKGSSTPATPFQAPASRPESGLT